MRKTKYILKSNSSFIPVCTPCLTGDEIKLVNDCLKTNWISSQGKYIELFEKEFAKFCNVKYAVAVTSGTTALHLALAALDIKKGDEVIIPSFTMIATAFAISYTGAKPVLVDVESDTGNIDVSQIEMKITKRTKAIIPVHIYGHPCDMDPLVKIARKGKIFVIEDAAEAHGALYKKRKVGSLGELACFSFYANKIITTGEGGMVIAKNKKVYDRLQLLKNLAFTKKRFIHEEIGFNYRITNIQAAIGLAQLKNVNKFIKARRTSASYYNENLKKIDWIVTPIEKNYAKNVYWMYGVRLAKPKLNKRLQLMTFLRSNGIDTRSYFIGMHKQPVFRKMGLFKGEKYPITDKFAKTGLYLPSGSGLKISEINQVIRTIKRFV